MLVLLKPVFSCMLRSWGMLKLCDSWSKLAEMTVSWPPVGNVWHWTQVTRPPSNATVVKSVDPAALFVNGNYLRTFSRDFGDVTRLQPKDTFDVTLGYVLALNDSLTISTALSGVFVSETTFDAATLRQQELFSLQFGLTSFITEGLFIEPVVSFGLNGTGNTFVLGVSVPYTFRP